MDNVRPENSTFNKIKCKLCLITQKINWEDMFFNASDLRCTWFAKDGISDTTSFCPNQIKFLSPTIQENKGF